MNTVPEKLHNKIKIISNLSSRTLSFFLMNEKGSWCLVSNYSELSRKRIKSASICEVGEEILSILDLDYNTENYGIDIIFEGPEEEYAYLLNCIENHFKDRNITCSLQKTTVIAVAGKIASGKSTLIEEMCKFCGDTPEPAMLDGYTKYTLHPSKTIWYEIAGIDLGKENVEAAKRTFAQLAPDGITNFVYCISTNKIEQAEEEFIAYVRNTYPNIETTILLTYFITEENDDFVNKLSSALDTIKIIPVLAKSINSRNGTIEAFGLDTVSKYLFEGN